MPHIKQTHMYTTQLLREFSFPQDGPSYLRRSWFQAPYPSSTGPLPPPPDRSSRYTRYPSTLPINQVEIALLFLFHGEIADQLCLLSEIKAKGKNVETYNKDKAHIFQQRHLLKRILFKSSFSFFLNTCSFSKSYSLTPVYKTQTKQNLTKKTHNLPKCCATHSNITDNFLLIQ